MPSSTLQKRTRQKKKSRTITWETFQKKYLTREDEYKYEWLNGLVEKTPLSIDKTQLYILRNLQEFFMGLKFAGKISGQLIAEADLFFLENHRRPDICWLTDVQIDRLAEEEYEVPAFVIEVISNRDNMNKVFSKMQDYRAAKVQVVWHILPQHQEVHVYTGDLLDQMTICTDEKICSAAPALPAFNLPAEAIFRKAADKKEEGGKG